MLQLVLKDTTSGTLCDEKEAEVILEINGIYSPVIEVASGQIKSWPG